MYNLFVSWHEDAWDGEPFMLDKARCVREYTDSALTERFESFDAAAIEQLCRLPSIFAYENVKQLSSKLGLVTGITARRGEVRVDYKVLQDVFLTPDQFDEMAFDFDIAKFEMSRTHWAVKNVDLSKELHRHGIELPEWTRQIGETVDITNCTFRVGLSFAGESRALVQEVAGQLEGRLGPHSYFYDDNYVAQLARPGLDILLQDIYRNRSDLIVVFVGGDYQAKDWCGVEWRVIREILKNRGEGRVMYVRVDDGDVDGVLSTDGYVDARRYSATDIAKFIEERVNLL